MDFDELAERFSTVVGKQFTKEQLEIVPFSFNRVKRHTSGGSDYVFGNSTALSSYTPEWFFGTVHWAAAGGANNNGNITIGWYDVTNGANTATIASTPGSAIANVSQQLDWCCFQKLYTTFAAGTFDTFVALHGYKIRIK